MFRGKWGTRELVAVSAVLAGGVLFALAPSDAGAERAPAPGDRRPKETKAGLEREVGRLREALDEAARAVAVLRAERDASLLAQGEARAERDLLRDRVLDLEARVQRFEAARANAPAPPARPDAPAQPGWAPPGPVYAPAYAPAYAAPACEAGACYAPMGAVRPRRGLFGLFRRRR